ncbi:MAG: FAD-dependent monooxygenase [Alphaproteobacteria bacterium]
MRIVGAGPAGLYFALLMKKQDPAHDILIVEQDPPDTTYGFGVVFSDAALARIAKGDAEIFAMLRDAMEDWEDLAIVHKDRRVPIDGNAFAAIGRLRLLRLLQGLSAEAGVRMEFGTPLTSLDRLSDADLVVGADGLNSFVRRARKRCFRPRIRQLSNRFVWYGTPRVFETLTLTFRLNEHGAFVAHHYRYGPAMSTFIVECDQATWACAGLERMSDDEGRAYCERLFAPELGGHRLVSNRSFWRRFPVVTNERFYCGNVVLIGDALRTVHFSIGSGTRLAMEDAIFLAHALREEGTDVAAALALYEERRRPIVNKLLTAAAASFDWYESFHERMHLAPHELAYDYMTRSGRMSDERLRKTAPRFYTAYRNHKSVRR